MEHDHWPLILIEGVLVFGGTLAFGWWQLRSVKRDRERLQEEKRRMAQEAQQSDAANQASQAQDHGLAHGISVPGPDAPTNQDPTREGNGPKP